MNTSEVASLMFPLPFIVNDYIWLFLMGMAVAILCAKNNLNVRNPMFYVIVGVVLFLLISLDKVSGKEILLEWKTILYGLVSSIIVFGLVQAENKGQIILGNKWLQVLGGASYALYLIHFPLISILCKLSILIRLDSLGVVGAMISYVVIFSMCIAMAIVFHLWIEKPLASYFKNYRINKPLAAET